MKQAKSTMTAAIAQDLNKRFDDPEARHSWIAVAHTCNEEAAKEFADELREMYPNTGHIVINPLSLSVACHIGPGALAVAVTKCLDEDLKKK